MSIDISRTRLGNFDVTWNSYAFGAVDGVKPDMALKTKEIKVGSIGDVVLGDRIIGLEAKIEIEAREIDLALYKKLCPWWSSGSIAMVPATVHKDLYDYAATLTLHPNDPAGVSGVTEDLNFIKAVPLFKPLQRDGEKDDMALVGFNVYPDRSQLPTLVYGYIGAVPQQPSAAIVVNRVNLFWR